MSIKPVAWTDEEEIKALAENRDCGKMWHNGAVYDAPIPLYAIPDTHSVVPVDALNRIMELAGVALVYQPFGTKDRQNFDALMAIIEDKP